MAVPTYVQGGTADSAWNTPYTVSLAAPPTEGNVLVAYAMTGNSTTWTPTSLSPGTWTLDASGYAYNASQYGGPGDGVRLVAYSRTVAASESGTITISPGIISTSLWVAEFAGAEYPPTASSGTATVTISAGTSLSAVVAQDSLLLVGWGMQRTAYAPPDEITPITGNTELMDSAPSFNAPHRWAAYGTASSGTVTVGGTPAVANFNKWGVIQIGYLFAGTAASPVAQFAGTPTSGDTPLAVTFTDQSSGTPTSWAWTFGDSGSSTAQHPSHTYTSSGTYSVSLVATSASGSGTATRTDYIVATEPEPGLSIGTAAVFSDRAMSWRITRGASPEITGGATVGQATIIVQNYADDQFNPENDASPIADQLVDGTPLWIGVNEDGRLSGTAVRGLFGGFITDITPVPVPGATYPPTVEITAEDALGRLGRTRISLPLSRTRSHGDLRGEVIDAAGITSYTLPPEIGTMPVSGADGYALGVLEALNRSTGTRHFIEPGDSASAWYTYTARDRHWHLSGTAQASLSGTAHVAPPSGWRRSADTVVNQQRVTFTPIAFTPAQVTVWEADTLPFTLTAAEREFWIQFDSYVDSPAVDINSTGGTVSTSLTAFGDTAKLIVSTPGTAVISGLSVEGSLARRAPDESVVANDAVSQDLPRGVRSGPDISGDYVGTLASARGLAQHVVWRYSDPQVRPMLTVTNWFPYQFELDLFDLISFSSPQLGVTDRLFEIVGITHLGNHAGSAAIHHETTYVLQECRVQTTTNWFTTDAHAPDGSAILGY